VGDGRAKAQHDRAAARERRERRDCGPS
jgi:hypothetical protein